MADQPRRGRLFYVMGPSGAGKDTLLGLARAMIGAEPDAPLFVTRAVTRPADAGGESHAAVSEAEFDRQLQAGAFVMHWQANGLRYGIGPDLEVALAQGRNAVVNGSRQYLPEARRRFPDLCAVLVTASPETIAARLRARGREAPAEIDARLARRTELDDATLSVIENEGDPRQAAARLAEMLRQR